MTLPLVTIMIPTYNQEEYISEAVQSALKQDYKNLEIIVADDCSDDNTEAIVKKFDNDPRLRYVRNPVNLGRVGNYHNCVHELAQGEWVINLDGDDFFTSSSFVSDAVNSILQLDDHEIVAYCFHQPIDIIRRLFPIKQISENSFLCEGKDYFLHYYRHGGFGHHSILWRKDIGLKIGMYLIPWQACDFHAIIRIFLNGKIILDDRQIAHWRVHGQNTTILQVEDKQRQAQLTFDAIEAYAKDFFSDAKLKKWREGMNKAAYTDYISSHVFYLRNFKSLKLLLLNPYFKKWYFRSWFKLIFNR
ncbi:MAG: glycosyltransferase [Muribaculaceae bacterium]|nr:glycosyltransferase [Muribaculaceae bacterium]